MQSLIRFIQLLTIVIWVGGLIFFAFILAPTAFHTLPSIHLAGMIVGATLRPFHIVGLVCGAIFLLATAFLFRTAPMRIRGRYEMQFLLAAIMLTATGYLQQNVLPSMESDRASAGGSIETAPADSPAKLHFDKLHARSERIEGAVLILGLGIVFLISRDQLPDPA